MRIRIPRFVNESTGATKGKLKKKVPHLGKPTNLYLNKKVTTQATEVAFDRYHLSLSGLVGGLLKREVEAKRGLLKQKPRRRAA